MCVTERVTRSIPDLNNDVAHRSRGHITRRSNEGTPVTQWGITHSEELPPHPTPPFRISGDGPGDPKPLKPTLLTGLRLEA